MLKYVKSAVAETDVPEALPEFISQRRRWLNGSFFAATYAIAHLGQILSSGHSIARKVLLVLETFYNVINLIAAWFAVVSAAAVRCTYIRYAHSPCRATSICSLWAVPFTSAKPDTKSVISGHPDVILGKYGVRDDGHQVLQRGGPVSHGRPGDIHLPLFYGKQAQGVRALIPFRHLLHKAKIMPGRH